MLAFCLWAEGFSGEEKLKAMRAAPPKRYEIIANKHKVERRRIPDYFTAAFWHNLHVWDVCQKYGLPYDKGWAQHPARLIAVLSVFNAANTEVLNNHGNQ